MCSDEKCQETPNVQVKPNKLRSHMQLLAITDNVWLKKPAMKSSNKKLIGSAKDKNCHATIYEYDDFQSQSSKCSDKNSQGKENNNMWSVTNSEILDVQLPKPAVLHKYKRLCSDKNCQSTRCYTKYVKNHQSV